MKILLTPKGVTAGCAAPPLASQFATVPDGEGGSLRNDYLDEGPRDGRPVVFLHGNPSWS